ncbi:MAG: phosphoserine transaminase, partial [Actinomycetota bacterium]|nr:phosphoserine transaminase [Actinomycetota bacterium]
MGKETPQLIIPENLKPKDLRFGSGPSKIRATQIAALAA